MEVDAATERCREDGTAMEYTQGGDGMETGFVVMGNRGNIQRRDDRVLPEVW